MAEEICGEIASRRLLQRRPEQHPVEEPDHPAVEKAQPCAVIGGLEVRIVGSFQMHEVLGIGRDDIGERPAGRAAGDDGCRLGHVEQRDALAEEPAFLDLRHPARRSRAHVPPDPRSVVLPSDRVAEGPLERHHPVDELLDPEIDLGDVAARHIDDVARRQRHVARGRPSG